MKISIITGNSGKYEQIVSALSENIVVEQIDLDIPEIQTNHLEVISDDKCRKAFSQVGGPVLIDDTGIYFNAFNEFPGALTKFLYAGIGLKGIQNMYAGVTDTSAYFQTVLGYMDEQMTDPLLFIGKIHGTISFDRLDKAVGDARLPYDMIFIPEGYKTPAYFNMSLRKKGNARIQAVEKFNEWMLHR